MLDIEEQSRAENSCRLFVENCEKTVFRVLYIWTSRGLSGLNYDPDDQARYHANQRLHSSGGKNFMLVERCRKTLHVEQLYLMCRIAITRMYRRGSNSDLILLSC